MRLFFLSLLFVVGIVGAASRSMPGPDAIRFPISRLSEVQVKENNGQAQVDRSPAKVLDSRHKPGQKIIFCNTCHSSEMHRSNQYLPILQGQNESYLLKKLRLFRGDTRVRHPFPRVSQALSDAELIEIAGYYSRQPSPLRRTYNKKPWLTVVLSEHKTGRLIEDCLVCHGNHSIEAAAVPRVTGQNEKYLAYRIREIANRGSAIHIEEDGPLKCRIPAVTIAESRMLAGQLAMVVDQRLVSKGKAIYEKNCLDCHDVADRDSLLDWKALILSGLVDYARQASRWSVSDDHERIDISHQNWINTLHYLLSE